MSAVSVVRDAAAPAGGSPAGSGASLKVRPAGRTGEETPKAPPVIRRYVQLAKPGIVIGNLISVTGGFFLASRGHVDLALLLTTLLGVSLVVASGCAINNVIDRDIDVKMARTRNRVLVRGLVSPWSALAYGIVLGLAGVFLLYRWANPLSAGLVVFGFAIYVGCYSLYAKRYSVHGTLIGSLSGAMPPVVGYCAVTGRFDLGAALLLIMFSLWQMPHSYAIAIFRFDDYAAAGIPVQPVKRGIRAAKRQILLYTLAFGVSAVSLTFTGYAGYAYLVVAAATGLYGLGLALAGYRAADDRIWARKLFVWSIAAVMALSVAMALDGHSVHLLRAAAF